MYFQAAWVKPRPLQHCAARQTPHGHRHPESAPQPLVAYARGIVVCPPASRNAGEWMSVPGRPPASCCASYFGTRQLHSRHGSKISHIHGVPRWGLHGQHAGDARDIREGKITHEIAAGTASAPQTLDFGSNSFGSPGHSRVPLFSVVLGTAGEPQSLPRHQFVVQEP